MSSMPALSGAISFVDIGGRGGGGDNRYLQMSLKIVRGLCN